MSGSCIYFETSKKTHSDAKDNCKTVFGPGSTGRLLEPRSSIMNQEVYDAATTLSQIDADDSLWLGITNFRNSSVFEYESDSQAVISGLWDTDPRQPNDPSSHHCVVVDEGKAKVLVTYIKICMPVANYSMLLQITCIQIDKDVDFCKILLVALHKL